MTIHFASWATLHHQPNISLHLKPHFCGKRSSSFRFPTKCCRPSGLEAVRAGSQKSGVLDFGMQGTVDGHSSCQVLAVTMDMSQPRTPKLWLETAFEGNTEYSDAPQDSILSVLMDTKFGRFGFTWMTRSLK